MSNALAKYEPAAPAPMDLMTLGKMLSGSGYFTDARDAAQAVVKVLAGQELGIGPIAAMTGIYIVKGRVTMSANLMAAQIKRSGRYNYRVARLDDGGCELVFFEGSQEIGRSSFTAEDAKAAGLWNSSDPWKKSPRNMLFARAMSNGAKWYTPDIFAGPVYTPDELGDAPVVEVASGTVNTVTGEIVQPAAEPEPADDGRRELSGVVEQVEAAYSKSGKLTMRFRLSDYTVLVLDAAEELAQMEDGDPVHVIGTLKTYKGQEVLQAETVAHTEGLDADGLSVWAERAAGEPAPAAA